jgi:glycosyltransferase involved in cell wall biosynthesis
MKVLQILPELNAGGVERGTLELGEFLVLHGHESLVVSNGGRLVEKLEKQGSRHITMSVHRKSPLSLLHVRPLRRLLERERPDILHIRSRVPGWIAWLAWRGMKPGTRPHFVSTVHGFNSVNFYSAIMTHGERVIAVSESIYDYIRQNYPKLPPEIIRVIPRGIEPKEYPRDFRPDPAWLSAWQKQFPQLAGKRVLTLPGRITRLKGHEDFLKLIKALSAGGERVHGLIVGGAHEKKQSYLDEIRSLARQLGVENHVSFAGHRTDLREILAVSDVVFSLSTQPESFGRTTLEALALGRPVVAYDHGGVGEQLRVIFPSGCVPLRDEAALLQAAKRVLVGAETPAPIPQAYTLDVMCAATLDTYAELLRNG